MKILLLAVLAATTGFTFVTCHPAEDSSEREKRASSSASASASSSSSGGLSSSNSYSSASANDNFGIGSGLGNGGRIGGCSGFGCGFQFGAFQSPYPSFGNNGGFPSNDPGSGFPNMFNNNFPNNYNNYNYPQYQYPNMGFGFNSNYPMFRDFQFAPNPVYQPQAPFPSTANTNLADFARIGGGSVSSSSNNGGRGTFSSFSSSNNNGIYSGTATRVDPDGRVTTYQSGPGAPDSIQTRILPVGSSKGVYSATGVNVAPDGKVTSYRAGGQL